MGLIIDSSIIIAAERGSIDFTRIDRDLEVYISAITVTEILVGILRANTEERRVKRSAFVEHIISTIETVAFGVEEARVYSQILNNLFAENITIGTHDMMISATAIASGHSVLTMNSKDFNRIKGLNCLTMEDIKS